MDQTYYDEWSGLYFKSNKEVLKEAQEKFTKERFNEICSWRNREEYEEIKASLEFNTKCMLDKWKERVAYSMAEEFVEALGFTNCSLALKEHLKMLLLKE